MSKILLVYEDYAELMSVESSLKKIGFDVLGVTNEYSLSEQVLSFNPEIVVACGRGGKVSSLGVGKRLKEMSRWPGQVILIFAPNGKPSAQELIKIRADLMLEAPVPPLRLIQVLAKLLGQDEAQLIERLNKIMHTESPAGEDRFFVGGGSPTAKDDGVVRIHGEREEDAQDTAVSGGEEEGGGSFLSRVKKAKDLFGAKESVSAEPESEKLFPDVDLKSLEAELSGNPSNDKASSEKTDKELSFNLNQNESDVEAQIAFKEELKKAQDSVAERVAKYSKLTESVAVSPLSTVRRVDARRRQRELVKDWDKNSLKDLDELRREFTKALFKK